MFDILPTERVGLFIDGANLHAAARSVGYDIDFQKLRKFFGGRGKLVRSFYFTGIREDLEYDPQHALMTWLAYNHFTMITKPTKTFTNNEGRMVVKGNMDVEIAVYMIEAASYLDHIILFSGDGDFRLLVEHVQRMGKQVTVVSALNTARPQIADELRRQADTFIDLANDEVREAIARTGYHDTREPIVIDEKYPVK